MRRVKGRVLFWIVAGLLIAVFAGSILLLRSITLPQRYRGLIESRLRAVTDRDVRVGRASLRFLGGIGIEFKDLVIKDRDGRSDFIRAGGLILQMKLLPLLRRQLKWKSLIIEKPSLHLRRSPKGDFNFSGKRKEPILTGEREYPHILRLLSSFVGGDIRVRKGRVLFEDDFVASGPIIAGVENLSLEFTSISLDGPIAFGVQARQRNSKGPDGRISIIGKLHPLPDPIELSKIRIAAEVRAKSVNPLPFRPYYRAYIAAQGIEGFLDINAHYEGNFSGLFRSWGQIKLKDVALDYPHLFVRVLRPKNFDVDYDVMLDMGSLIISDLSLRLPEVEIRGRGTIHEINSARRRIEAFANTGPFRFVEVKKYLPLRVISPGFKKLLEKVTSRGKGRILSLRMKGPMEDFSRLKDPEKGNLIYGKMRLDGVVFPFAKAFYPIENISGWMILEEGSLRFQDLRGYFGKSRLNAVEMIISRIYTSPELDLSLDGEVDLKGIMTVARPGGPLGKGVHLPAATVSGKATFSRNRVRIMGVKGKVGNSAFWGKGEVGNPWHVKQGRKRLNLSLGGELDLQELFSRILPGLFPEISKTMASFSDISGGARVTLELNRGGKGVEGIRYKGMVSLGDAILRHRRMVSPVRFRKGHIHFTPKVIRVSQMEARLRGSRLKIEGTLRDYLAWERSRIAARIHASNLDIGDFRLKKGGGWGMDLERWDRPPSFWRSDCSGKGGKMALY